MNETDEPRGKERTVVRLMEKGYWEGETHIRQGRQTMMLVYVRREQGDEDQTSASS